MVNSDIKVWNYKYDADITFGEVHVSKLPKIILTFVIIGIIVLGVTIFLFKDYIYDYANNPQLQFNEKVEFLDGEYAVDYEVSNSAYFKPEAYMEDATYNKANNSYDIDTNNLAYTYEITGDDITKQTEVGDYKVIYNSSNRVSSESKELIVHLKDTTPPVINFELSDKAEYHVDLDKTGSCQLVLIKGKDTTNFDPRKYIKSVTDNYSKEDKIKIEYPSNITFNQDTIDIIYAATDEADNTATASLKLIIKEDIDKLEEERQKALKAAEEEKKRRLEEEKKRKEEEEKKKEQDSSSSDDSSTSPKTTTNNNQNPGGNVVTTQYYPAVTNPPQTTTAPPPTTTTTTTTEKPSIKANPVTVSIKEGEDAIVQKCINNVIFRGTTGSAQPYGMPGFDCQLAVGTYTITWKTTNGLSCTQKLTITE